MPIAVGAGQVAQSLQADRDAVVQGDRRQRGGPAIALVVLPDTCIMREHTVPHHPNVDPDALLRWKASVAFIPRRRLHAYWAGEGRLWILPPLGVHPPGG